MDYYLRFTWPNKLNYPMQYSPSNVFCSSNTCVINRDFSSISSELISGSKPTNKYILLLNTKVIQKVTNALS